MTITSKRAREFDAAPPGFGNGIKKRKKETIPAEENEQKIKTSNDENADQLERVYKIKIPSNLSELLLQEQEQSQEEVHSTVEEYLIEPIWFKTRPDDELPKHPRYICEGADIEICSSDSVGFQLSSKSLPDEVAKTLNKMKPEVGEDEYEIIELKDKVTETAAILELVFDLMVYPTLPFGTLVSTYSVTFINSAHTTAKKLNAQIVVRTLRRSAPYYLGPEDTWDYFGLAANCDRKEIVADLIRREVERVRDKYDTTKFPCYFCYWQDIKGHKCKSKVLYDVETWPRESVLTLPYSLTKALRTIKKDIRIGFKVPGSSCELSAGLVARRYLELQAESDLDQGIEIHGVPTLTFKVGDYT